VSCRGPAWLSRRATHAVLALATLGAWCAAGRSAHAQGLLPASGTDIRVGDLRDAFGSVYDRTAVAQSHTIIYTPTLDVSETYGTALPQRNGGNASDFITQVTPGIAIAADTLRVNGRLYYAPSLDFYAEHGNQTQLQQNLNAAATVTVVPDLLFVDLRGYATQTSLSGGQGQSGSYYNGGQNAVSSSSYSISPYLKHSFGGTGTLLVGASISRTMQDTNNNGYVTSPYYQSLNGNVTTQQENASFTTGPDFGRLQNTFGGTAIQYSGSGSLHGAYNNSFGDSAQYAVSRFVALTGALGYEDISYGGPSPYRIDDITWSGGFILTPNADSSLAVSYGHSNGGDSLTVNGVLAPTARSRVILRYSQALETNQQQFQEAVARSTVGAGGVSVDPVTGAPLLLSNNTLAAQPGVYRTTQASVTGSLLYARDVFSASIEQDTNKQVGGTASGLGNSSGVSTTASWSHDLSPDITTNAFAQYRTQNLVGFGVPNTTQDTLSLSFNIGYALSQTLGLNASYTFINTDHAVLGQAGEQQIVVIGLHKSF
jgi:uncharacterized protein (PEP-CTERM system associated)